MKHHAVGNEDVARSLREVTPLPETEDVLFEPPAYQGARSAGAQRTVELPSVEELLDVDHEYRERAAAGTLRLIAPRRMNPRHEAWLPILHTTRGSRHYTALYSNTPNAHRQGQTHDWVVLYVDHDGSGGKRQWTVITAHFGSLVGHRVVRGREKECLQLMRRRKLEAIFASTAERGGGTSVKGAMWRWV
jgi:hypothetical protein